MSALRIKNTKQGFVAQLEEHRTGIAEVTDLNPIGASEFFFWALFVTA